MRNRGWRASSAASVSRHWRANGLDGQVIGQCQQRHTHAQWLKFLKRIDRKTPKDKTPRLIAGHYATHKPPLAQEWLAKHPRFVMHFTAAWASLPA